MTANIVHAHFLRQWSNQECLERRQDRDSTNTMKKEIRSDLTSKNKIADIKEAKQYVNNHNDDRKAKRYLKANARFNIALKDIEEKRYFKFIIDGILLTFTSFNFFN